MNQDEWEARIFVAGAKTGRPPNRPVGEPELRQVFGRFGAITKIRTGTVHTIAESHCAFLKTKDFLNRIYYEF